jgi:prepilin-type N-terminal cleavage/methylation domain-containing protein
MEGRTCGGFTLLELAIVVLIVSLLAASVLSGRDLIRSSELRKSFAQYEQISTAINAFTVKYECIPGDCLTAAELFNEHVDCPDLTAASFLLPATFTNNVPTDSTCNGDGDGRIDASKTVYEMTTLWQQLSMAGLIEGRYTGGLVSDGASDLMAGRNLPLARVRDGYGWLIFDGDQSVFFSAISGVESLALVPIDIGTVVTPVNFATDAPGAFTPAEAFAYDGKFDDGRPSSGRITQALMPAGAPKCSDASDETVQLSANASAQYFASDPRFKDGPRCTLLHSLGW